MPHDSRFKIRIRLIAILIALAMIPLGIGLKKFSSSWPGAWWVNNWASSVAYELMLMGLVFAIVPRRAWLMWIAVGVCAVTIGLEFLQAWKPGPDWLEAVRANPVGRLAIGNSFSWWDIPAYPIGCAVGWALLGLCVRVVQSRRDLA